MFRIWSVQISEPLCIGFGIYLLGQWELRVGFFGGRLSPNDQVYEMVEKDDGSQKTKGDAGC